MAIELTEKSIKDMLGSPIDISGLDSKDVSLSEIAFNLYRETAIITIIVSHLFESTHAENAFIPRNQAIEVGLAVRITKYMSAIMALIADKVREHGEVIMTLNRCITESAINLQFFCEKAQPEDYDEFVNSSLKPERDTRKIIHESIRKRGEELPIETRMLSSIERTFKVSGIEEINELESKSKRKNYRQILEALDMSYMYPILQGVPSHSIHGTWVDLVLHHLEADGSGFRPKPDAANSDTRLLLPTSLLVLYAVRSYVNSRLSSYHDTGTTILLERLKDLIQRISKVDAFDEQKLSEHKDSKT